MKRSVLKNNLFALKIAMHISPALVFHSAMVRVLDYFEWLFYSAFFMKYIINTIEGDGSYHKLLIFLGISVLVFAGISLYNCYVQEKFLPVVRIDLNDKLTDLLFEKARQVDIKCFEDEKFYNKYTLAVENADTRIEETLNSFFGVLFGAIATIIAFIIMFRIDHYVGLFVIFPLVGNFGFGKVVNKIAYSRNREMAPSNRRIEYINRVVYMRDYAKEMRLSNVRRLLSRQYDESIDEIKNLAFKYGFKGIIFHWLKVVFTFSIIFEGVLLYGAYRSLVSQTMSFAEFSVLSSIMVAATWILIGFADSINLMINNGLFVENLRLFLEYTPDIPEDYEGIEVDSDVRSIEFKNVSFYYKDKKVIDSVSFKMDGDKSYALVGCNGAGKSTIVKLLMRFYDPTEGEILLNNRNIKEYNLHSYRTAFASAFQENQIFAMPLEDNVKMGLPDSDMRYSLDEALKRSGIDEKVSTLPKKERSILSKELSNDGVQLSGGEFQKILVSRAMIRNTPIKIYDEPSSALDPISENNLFDNILSSDKGKLLMFISHRLSSVQCVDKIFMLENGKLIESGNHTELMNMNGKYADMYNKQAQNYLALEEKGDINREAVVI